MGTKPVSTLGQISGSSAYWHGLLSRKKSQALYVSGWGSGVEETMLPARVSSWEVGADTRRSPRPLSDYFQQEANLPSQTIQFPELAMFSSASGLLLSLLPEILFPLLGQPGSTLPHASGPSLVGPSWSSSAYIYGASTLWFLRPSA